MTEHDAVEGVTVGAAAIRVGVTVRTLHHWDELGLAVPTARTRAGYRLYTPGDLDRLQRIVAYREAGLGLDDVKAVLDDTSSDTTTMLRAQRDQLASRIADLQRIDARLARMTEAHERGILLDSTEQREVFGEGWDPEGPAQARSLWGGTDQWAQFAERSSRRTAQQWRELTQEMAAFEQELAAAIDDGTAPGTAGADALVERHREIFSNFFTLTREMQVCLWRMFEADEGFSAYYDGIRSGLTTWFRTAVDASARRHGIDPDAAIWR